MCFWLYCLCSNCPTHRTKLGPLCWFSIFTLLNIEPLIGEVFTTRFVNCHFDENVFSLLGGGKPILEELLKITWNESSLSHLGHPTKQSEQEVQKIIHLQDLVNRLPDGLSI